MYQLDIAEVTRRTGLSASTLRYYEKRGLISADSRNGLRRQYDDSVLNKLGLIALGQRAGYSLDDIADLFRPAETTPNIDRGALRSQADALRAQARELEATAELLDHVANCSAPSHLECPRFLALLKNALATRDELPDAESGSRSTNEKSPSQG